MSSRFKKGDIIRKVKDHHAVRVVIEVREDSYEVRLGKVYGSTTYTIPASYVHQTYELDPIEDSPLARALR